MPHFVVVGHRASTSPSFRIEDVPGTAGRLDVLVRAANAAFVLSHGLRVDSIVTLVLLGPPDPPRSVRFTGARLRHLNPDERSTTLLVQKALAIPPTAHVWQSSTPGIEVARRGFESALDDALAKGGRLVLLDERGEDASAVELRTDDVFVLGDPDGLTDEERAILRAREATTIRVSPVSLHADHAIVLLLAELDRRRTRNEPERSSAAKDAERR